MRELLDLATEKDLRSYVEKAIRSGLQLSLAEAATAEKESDKQFEAQVKDAWDE